MIPLQKVKDIISKHDVLEKELSSGALDPKSFAKKSNLTVSPQWTNVSHW